MYRNYLAAFFLSHIDHAGHMSKLIGKVFNDKMACFENISKS
jgi:hypothetical protein